MLTPIRGQLTPHSWWLLTQDVVNPTQIRSEKSERPWELMVEVMWGEPVHGVLVMDVEVRPFRCNHDSEVAVSTICALYTYRLTCVVNGTKNKDKIVGTDVHCLSNTLYHLTV